MAAGSSGSGYVGFDPQAITLEYIKSLGLDHSCSGYKLLNLRDKATSKEIAIVARKYALDLHPDKNRVNQWMDWRGIKDEALQRQVRDHLSQFYHMFLQEKDKLVDFDEKLFKQATHRVTSDLLCSEHFALNNSVCRGGTTHTLKHYY